MPRPSKAEADATNWRFARIMGPWMIVTGLLFLRTSNSTDDVYGMVAGVLNLVFGSAIFVIALMAFRRTTQLPPPTTPRS